MFLPSWCEFCIHSSCECTLTLYSFISQLRYLPIEQKSIQNINMRNCNPTHEGTPDLSSLTCERNVDTSTGLISVHFNWVYEHIPSIQDAITEYRIVLNSEVEITDDRNVVIVGDIFELDPDPTQPYEVNTVCAFQLELYRSQFMLSFFAALCVQHKRKLLLFQCFRQNYLYC